jgi:hypothetical protein
MKKELLNHENFRAQEITVHLEGMRTNEAEVRGLTQHGGPPGCLEESNPVQVLCT